MTPLPEESSQLPPVDDGHFRTTHWSVVARAGQVDTAEREMALGQLCRAYWYPLYAYIRWRGHRPHDAEDLTQGFFEKLLDKNYLTAAEQEKGKFRTFLLTALKRFLANEWDRQHAQKRGGFAPILSIDQERAEARLQAEPVCHGSPDLLFDQQWATALLDEVMSRLQGEYLATGRGLLFEELRACLVRDRLTAPYADIGARLGLSEAAVKMAVQRLRIRYRQLLRDEIGRTVSSPQEVEEEIRHLFATFRAPGSG